jgi:hypothetical protein
LFVYYLVTRFSLLLALIVTSSLVPGAAVANAPTLRIRAIAPLTVAGSRFVVRERVTLTLRVAGRRVARRAVTAGSRGAFRAGFSTLVAVDPCRGSIVISAVGAAGSRASARRPCLPPDPQVP